MIWVPHTRWVMSPKTCFSNSKGNPNSLLSAASSLVAVVRPLCRRASSLHPFGIPSQPRSSEAAKPAASKVLPRHSPPPSLPYHHCRAPLARRSPSPMQTPSFPRRQPSCKALEVLPWRRPPPSLPHRRRAHLAVVVGWFLYNVCLTVTFDPRQLACSPQLSIFACHG